MGDYDFTGAFVALFAFGVVAGLCIAGIVYGLDILIGHLTWR